MPSNQLADAVGSCFSLCSPVQRGRAASGPGHDRIGKIRDKPCVFHRCTPPQNVLSLRQVSWLAGQCGCLGLPNALEDVSDLMLTTAHRLQLRGQHRNRFAAHRIPSWLAGIEVPARPKPADSALDGWAASTPGMDLGNPDQPVSHRFRARFRANFGRDPGSNDPKEVSHASS